MLSYTFGIAHSDSEVSPCEDGFLGICDTNRTHQNVKWGLIQHPVSHRSDWENRQSDCQNCGYKFLTCLSKDSSFCSVDCRTTATYMLNVKKRVSGVQENRSDSEDAAMCKNKSISSVSTGSISE